MAIFSSGEGDSMAERQPRGPARDATPSIVAADLTVIGELKTDGVIKVDGVVEGNIRAGKQVLISRGGVVKGDVIAKEAIVGGRVEGSIQADERVEIQETSVVHGDIVTLRILVHEGGEVNGNVRMGTPDARSPTSQSAQ